MRTRMVGSFAVARRCDRDRRDRVLEQQQEHGGGDHDEGRALAGRGRLPRLDGGRRAQDAGDRAGQPVRAREHPHQPRADGAVDEPGSQSTRHRQRDQETTEYAPKFGVQPADFAPQGGTYEFKFTKPGVYLYYCSLHGTPDQGMVGAVIVGDAEWKPPQDARGRGEEVGDARTFRATTRRFKKPWTPPTRARSCWCSPASTTKRSS